MSDHFAALGIAETLLPDDEALKDRFYAASAQFHPDAAEADEEVFLRIGEAYGILRDPARRTIHLLELHQRKPADTQQPPSTVQDLFFTANSVLQSAGESWKHYNATSAPLRKAMLLGPLLEAGDLLADLLATLNAAIAQNLSQLSLLEISWPDLSEEQWSALARIAASLSYLTKWKNETQQSQSRIAETASGALA